MCTICYTWNKLAQYRDTHIHNLGELFSLSWNIEMEGISIVIHNIVARNLKGLNKIWPSGPKASLSETCLHQIVQLIELTFGVVKSTTHTHTQGSDYLSKAYCHMLYFDWMSQDYHPCLVLNRYRIKMNLRYRNFMNNLTRKWYLCNFYHKTITRLRKDWINYS